MLLEFDWRDILNAGGTLAERRLSGSTGVARSGLAGAEPLRIPGREFLASYRSKQHDGDSYKPEFIAVPQSAESQVQEFAGSTDEPVRLGSFCTVFAKTEILSHLREGAPVAGIVRGAFVSVVDRIIEMDPLEGMVVATGGVVAHNPVIVEVLAERLGREVIVPEAPQFTGALGAALTARKLATT